MDHRLVEALEDQITEALAEAMQREFGQPLPLVPSPHNLHLMAKAAVTVYEAAVDGARAKRRD